MVTRPRGAPRAQLPEFGQHRNAQAAQGLGPDAHTLSTGLSRLFVDKCADADGTRGCSDKQQSGKKAFATGS